MVASGHGTSYEEREKWVGRVIWCGGKEEEDGVIAVGDGKRTQKGNEWAVGQCETGGAEEVRRCG